MRTSALFLTLLLLSKGATGLAQTPAERGYQTLINGDYIGCGIPLDVFKRATAVQGLIPPFVVSSFFPISSTPVFAPSSLKGRNADNAGVHSSFNVFETPRGVKAANFNCLSCHSDTINGQFILGVGNRSRDFTQDIRGFTSVLPAFVRTDAEREEVHIFQRSMNAIAPYIRTKTIGTNPAINLTYALFAHRNTEDYTWSDAPLIAPPNREFPPIDVPPWWRMKHKASMFYNGEFNNNHSRIMKLASTLCIEDSTAMLALDEPFHDVEAFVKQVEAPPYPRTVDSKLAANGRTLFNRTCSGCHGVYGQDGSITYSTKVIPIDVIGTDPALMEQQSGPEDARFRRRGEDLYRNLHGEELNTQENRGYVAPPLNGIWATAPFFHNGSVPSLEGVLNSARRPRFWWKKGVGFDEDYDVANVAVKYDEMPFGQNLALPLTKRYVYDTSLYGHGNGGHRFGDALTPAERKAVIEYLKTL